MNENEKALQLLSENQEELAKHQQALRRSILDLSTRIGARLDGMTSSMSELQAEVDRLANEHQSACLSRSKAHGQRLASMQHKLDKEVRAVARTRQSLEQRLASIERAG